MELYPYIDDPDCRRPRGKGLSWKGFRHERADADRGGPLWGWLELLRLPNLFTAVADVAMGFLFVQVAAEGDVTWQMQPADAATLLLLAAASACSTRRAWCSTTSLDVDVDRQQRPERPIPSGRVSLAAARRAGWLLLAVGAALTWIAAFHAGHVRPGLVGLLLAAAIVLYDLGLKRTPLGPVGMGACRMLNVLLGMSVLAGPLRRRAFPRRRRHRRLRRRHYLAGQKRDRPRATAGKSSRPRW